MDTLATAQLAILFWHYKEPAICANRLQLLRRLNPGVRIYGLYGGEISGFPQYDAALSPWLDDNWAFPEPKDPEWKWRHGDLMINAWYRARGHTLAWETLVIVQWDMITLAPIARAFGPMRNGTLYLPGLRSMTQIESRWWWVRDDSPVSEEYVRFKAWLTDRFGFGGPYFGCQFVTAALPRAFLDRYSEIEQAELGFLEYKLPAYASVFGIPCETLSRLSVTWPGEESNAQRIVLSAKKTEISDRTIAIERLLPNGARLFHPVARKFPATRMQLARLMARELRRVAIGKLQRLLKPIYSLLVPTRQPIDVESTIMPIARRKCDLVFVMAAAEGEWVGIRDLLDSLETYIDCDYEVLVIDDATTDGTYEKLRDEKLWLMRNPRKLGYYGLDLTIRRAFTAALKRFNAPIFVKIDPDALVIGPGLHEALMKTFTAQPQVGIAGTYTVDWNGAQRDPSYWAEQMKRVQKDLGLPLEMALRRGYPIGNSVQGGCYAFSGTCLTNIAQMGCLDGWSQPHRGKGKYLAEDVIMTMLCFAAGYTAADIGGPNQPFGLWYPGMPTTPEELVAQGRIVTHAIKYTDEASLSARAFFRARREAYKAARRH